jgi:predicted transcriptional regulator
MFPYSLLKKSIRLLDGLERSRGWIVKQALAAWVEQEEKRHLMTVEAFADVDNGQVIDHAAVKAWAESLDTVQALPVPH